ncbi:enoyl-CoA hydratase-related protein [Ottowia sp.]|jgi:enoyl-CoA hydratase|uniref:enoyl-CoA hydratase/isomerase family protein n=1 Tax=Ottowia sp. TaxID=1898956 RepID=UPI0025E9705E|nr:enoyl-CoA hydratase-related protein [Ottowia sp.]MBK6614116.1 enoyl-CoA hydratase/isomerase family protein [Ottowia sp.]MBK6745327.1 enoyl-CoA hydratase/isomerase family protein [Ottowia sp.]
MTATTYESRDGIALITINRADARNAINNEVVRGLSEAWACFAASADDRVAVLAGAGGQAFSAGADLRDMPKDIWRAMPNFSVRCDKPIICAVTGFAVGAGSTFVMLADLAVAEEQAQFLYPEAKIGAFAGVMAGFPPRMQYKAGLEWLMTGDPMSAQRAYEIGLVNRVVPQGQGLAAALELAGKIAANAPLVVQAMKAIARDTLPLSPTERYYPQRAMLDGIANSEDIQEGVASFKEKRPPRFTGR